MKKIRYILSLAMALCLLCSCAKEEEVSPPAGKSTSKLRITVGELKVPAASGTTKSSENMSATEGLSVIWGGPVPATRQGNLANDQEVFDLLIAQVLPLQDDDYNFIGIKIVGTPQYYTSGDPRFQPDYANGDDAYTILDFEYLDVNSEIIGIANLGDPNFFETDATYDNEQWVEKLFVTYDSEADVTEDGKIIMVGSGGISSGNSSPYMDLIHMVSKINLTVNYYSGFSGGTLKINSVQLLSVPKMNSLVGMTYQTEQNSYNNHRENYVFPPVTENYQEFDNPRFDQLYPHNDASDLFMDYPAVEEDIASGSNFVWYMPEHSRGNNYNYSIYYPKDKYWKYDPSYMETAYFNNGEGISYATRIEIKGIYTPSVGKKQNVKFTIYPGEYDDSSHDSDYRYYYDYTHNNFDIYRNCCYNIIVNIKSLDETDRRIETSEITGVD